MTRCRNSSEGIRTRLSHITDELFNLVSRNSYFAFQLLFTNSLNKDVENQKPPGASNNQRNPLTGMRICKLFVDIVSVPKS